MLNTLEVRKTKKFGRGLYAKRNIKKGEIVERSPVVVIHNQQGVTSTIINTYVFEWRRDSSALALGLGSLFNHKNRANVSYNPVFSENEIIFVATKNIKKGEQCFIDYGYDPIRGYETTERSIYRALQQKFDPVPPSPIFKDLRADE